MHPLLKKPRALAAYLLAWALAAGALAAVWARQAPNEGLWVLGFLLPLALLTGLAALAIHPVCRGFPLRPARWFPALSRRAAVAGLLAVSVTGAAALWNATGLLWERGGLVALAPSSWLALIAMETLVFAVSALMHDTLLAQQTLQAAAAAEAEARLSAREMEIKVLRMQVDPHFLFNGLNSISALIPGDPAAARAMTIDLAQFFRQTLSLGERRRVRLDEELALVRSYLAIEQRRLGGKLRLAIDVDAACGAAWLPPLVLQPLVENAVKHGIRPLDQGGLIELSARHAGDRLSLRVSNPLDASARRDDSGIGQGLRHLRSRLQAQYDGDIIVDVERSGGCFSVQVSLPWQT